MPVNVDAIVFWHVRDARKASLEQAIDRVAQTSLREMIGSSMLQPSCLTGRLLSDERRRRGPLRLVTGMHTKGEKRSSKD